MPNLLPLRDFGAHEVDNFHAFTGNVAAKGTVVRLIPTEGVTIGGNPVSVHGTIGASYNNVVSPRWSISPRVGTAASGAATAPFGILLYDVKATDENGENLLFNRQKRDELQCVISGQAVPILKRGVVAYSGIDGNPSAGTVLYAAPAAIAGVGPGGLSTTGIAADRVGIALGGYNADGWVLVQVEL